MSTITRREALARLAAITGAMAVGGELFLSGCRAPEARHRSEPLSASELALLDEIGDTIIPTTTTPGAKAVGIGAFMAKMSHDCYDDASYNAFRGGLSTVDAESRSRFGKTFVQCTPAQRTQLLNDLDREQRRYAEEKDRTAPPHYFRLMKEMTLLGFFSSEVGCTQALRYVESPGRYDGDVPYRKGDRAWYNPSRRIS